jgi:hypothetical protein
LPAPLVSRVIGCWQHGHRAGQEELLGLGRELGPLQRIDDDRQGVAQRRAQEMPAAEAGPTADH